MKVGLTSWQQHREDAGCIELAPAPSRGISKLVYDTLESRGAMTRQQIRLATKTSAAQVGAALGNGVTRGWLVYGKHNHRYAVAPASHYLAGGYADLRRRQKTEKPQRDPLTDLIELSDAHMAAALQQAEAPKSNRNSNRISPRNLSDIVISVQLQPSQLKRVDQEVARRKSKKLRFATRTDVVRTAVKGYFRLQNKALAEIEPTTPKKWWKFWSKA